MAGYPKQVAVAIRAKFSSMKSSQESNPPIKLDSLEAGQCITMKQPRRSVSFANDPITRVISVPRYERETLPELFYNQSDWVRFRRDLMRERIDVKMIWWMRMILVAVVVSNGLMSCRIRVRALLDGDD